MINPITARARSLRKQQTEAESKLWYHLRAKRFFGIKFKRQEPIGPYFVDFVCHPRMLVIEVDGGHHAEPMQEEYDDERTAFLREKGYRVIRFWNNDVFNDIEGVLESLRLEIFGHQEIIC